MHQTSYKQHMNKAFLILLLTFFTAVVFGQKNRPNESDKSKPFVLGE